MRRLDQYLSTIDTIYPDGHARESYFRDAGDMLDPQPLVYADNGSLFSKMMAAIRGWHAKRRGRAVLRELTDFELNDIGVTPFEARREVRKSRFFD